jgi:hypothetical protein
LCLKEEASATIESLTISTDKLYSVETLTGIKFITWTWAILVKNPETGRSLFFLAYILVHMVFAYLLPEVRVNVIIIERLHIKLFSFSF